MRIQPESSIEIRSRLCSRPFFLLVFTLLVSFGSSVLGQTSLAESSLSCAAKDDTAALAAVIASGSTQTIVIRAGQTCAIGDLTIPNLRIERGGLLKPLTSHTVSLSGTF